MTLYPLDVQMYIKLQKREDYETFFIKPMLKSIYIKFCPSHNFNRYIPFLYQIFIIFAETIKQQHYGL